ncbi:MAG: YkoP family protein [Stellaceae bacterium]
MSLLHGGHAERPALRVVELRVPDKPRSDWLGKGFSSLDRLLRYVMRIREFCADRSCIIRVAIVKASAPVALSDGTRLRPGDLVGDLHLWNEQLPQLPWRGAGLAWALALRRQFARSFAQLAQHVERDPTFASVEAFRGGMTFTGSVGRRAKVARVASVFGFEIIGTEVESPRLRRLLDGVFIFFLIHTYNPACLKHGALKRRRYELWISKRSLVERHGRRGEGVRARKTQR